MTPEELGRALAAEMRMHAKTRRSQAADYARDAEEYQTKANVARREAARLTAMAEGWDRAAQAQLPLDTTQSLPVFGAAEVLSSTPLATAFGDAPARSATGAWGDPADRQWWNDEPRTKDEDRENEQDARDTAWSASDQFEHDQDCEAAIDAADDARFAEAIEAERGAES